MQKIISNSILGQNIKALRNSCGLTQEETVIKMQLLGSPISRSTYALIECGKGNIYASDLVALQKIFNTSGYDIFFKGIPPYRIH